MTSQIQLRSYQIEAVEKLRAEYAKGSRAVLLNMPTGSGKTTVFSFITQASFEKGKKILIIAHRTELITQAHQRLKGMTNIEAGIIKAGFVPSPEKQVQVASVQTLSRRPAMMCGYDFIVIDEAHHATASTYQKIIDANPDAKVLGVTATPYRSDGAGLGDVFQKIVSPVTIQELIEMDYLVKPRIFAPAKIDLSGIRKVGGDYNNQQLADRVNQSELVGDILSNWEKVAKNRKTVIFAVNVAHSIAIKERFMGAGYAIEHIDGSECKKRDTALAAFKSD